MRISDWSSDVCSSDLPSRRSAGPSARQPVAQLRRRRRRLAGGADITNPPPYPLGEGSETWERVPWSQRMGSRSLAHHRQAPPQPLPRRGGAKAYARSEEHTSELQSLMRISYAVFCLKKKNKQH